MSRLSTIGVCGSVLNYLRNRIEVIIRDDGNGFDAAAETKNASDISQLSGAGGRGLTLIRNFMDDVQFNEVGNEIRMGLKFRTKARRKTGVEV